MKLNEQEKKCVRILAKVFLDGKLDIYKPLALFQSEGLNVDEKTYEVLMRVMETIGAIGEKPLHAYNEPYYHIQVSAKAVSIARELDELDAMAKEPEDIVEKLTQTAKSNRTIGWIVFGFIIITAITVFAAAVLTIIDKVIDLQKKLG